MNRFRAFFCFSFILCIHQINAQEEIKVDTLIKNLRMDFAVPDLPAFNALQSEQSNLLRPSSPKEFSLIANEFFNGNNIIIPKAIAIEVAPIVLVRYNKLTLGDYQKNPVLYNSRISMGTMRDSNNRSRLAIGFRTTLLNKGDIKNDKNLKLILEDLRSENKGRNDYFDQELKKLGKSEEYFAEHPELQTKLNNEYDSIKSTVSQNVIDYKNYTYWNAEKLDLAFSFVGSSQDSIAKNIKYNSFLAWLTYAMPAGKNGQILAGLSINSYKKESSDFLDFSLQSRFYIGINQLKSFVECQYLYKSSDKSNNVIARLGCEYHLYNGIWIDFNAGIYKGITNSTSDFISSFRFIYAIPGNFK
jgi:hypothetical protein